jgi:hypothetical protein
MKVYIDDKELKAKIYKVTTIEELSIANTKVANIAYTISFLGKDAGISHPEFSHEKVLSDAILKIEDNGSTLTTKIVVGPYDFVDYKDFRWSINTKIELRWGHLYGNDSIESIIDTISKPCGTTVDGNPDALKDIQICSTDGNMCTSTNIPPPRSAITKSIY